MNDKKGKNNQILGYIIGEFSFVILPFLVITLIHLYKGDIDHIFSSTEWSIVSAVIFGQSIIKLIHAIGKVHKTKNIMHYNIGAIVSLIIVVGLVPCLILLALISISCCVPTWLQVIQIILFVLALVVFYFANWLYAFVEEDKV